MLNKYQYLVTTTKSLICGKKLLIGSNNLITTNLQLNRKNITSYSLIHTIRDYSQNKTTPIH